MISGPLLIILAAKIGIFVNGGYSSIYENNIPSLEGRGLRGG